MIHSEQFLDAARAEGFQIFAGVPCSHLTPLINATISSKAIQYIKATNEGDAVAICCGSHLGGKPGVAMFQNSGLGNAVNPLTSLANTFQIPLLIVCTWRGRPDGAPDEPQHELMGRITCSLFDLMEIPWRLFPKEPQDIEITFQAANSHWKEHSSPYALIVPKNAVAPFPLQEAPSAKQSHLPKLLPHAHRGSALDVDAVLKTIRENALSSDALLATTGYTGRALYALSDDPSHFYMVGSMGCISSLALGLAIAQPRRRVIAVDGDGAALMRMGAMATVGHYQPRNLLHILLDNGMHESTGGQSTVSNSISFPNVAAACGYPNVESVDDLQDLAEILRSPANQLTFAHVRTQPRSASKLPRPKNSPSELSQRFREWLQTSQ
jgi:phosphonopyruvate decarboxylase